MKLTVLGRYGVYPFANAACSGYLLEHNGRHILFDCGPGVLSKVIASGLSKLDAVVLSHLHWDHISDALVLRYALERMGHKIKMFLPCEPSMKYEAVTSSPMIQAIPIEDNMKAKINDISLSFLSMRHPVPTYGVRVSTSDGTLVYTGDTNTCEHVRELFSDAPDLAIVDACFTDQEWSNDKPHLSARLAARYAQEGGVKRLLLSHLTAGGDHDLLLLQAHEEMKNVELAIEGQYYTVPCEEDDTALSSDAEARR